MKHLFSLLLACFLITSCGMQETMSEPEALDMLQGVPMNQGEQNVFGEHSENSYARLESVLSHYAGNAQAKGLIAHTKGTSFGTLRNLFTILNSGEQHSTQSLAHALVDMDGGNVQKTSLNLSKILDIIKMVAPFISTLIPGLGPILTALLKILPLILSIFGIGG